jgi:cytochrome oxidase Cu insertion factor (SCO1/SenC/PrrC family)
MAGDLELCHRYRSAGKAPVLPRALVTRPFTDRDGRNLPLSRFRGKVVVLEFTDPHWTDICPLVSQEFVDAYHDLGRSASDVVFAAVNVNQYFNQVQAVLAYSRDHKLIIIPDWHFFTGSATAMQAVWRDYNFERSRPRYPMRRGARGNHGLRPAAASDVGTARPAGRRWGLNWPNGPWRDGPGPVRAVIRWRGFFVR